MSQTIESYGINNFRDRVMCIVDIDHDKKTITITDSDVLNTGTITDSISHIQEAILLAHGLDGPVDGWKWIIHDITGNESEYKDGKFIVMGQYDFFERCERLHDMDYDRSLEYCGPATWGECNSCQGDDYEHDDIQRFMQLASHEYRLGPNCLMRRLGVSPGDLVVGRKYKLIC